MTKCSAIKTRAEQVEELQASKKSEWPHTCERPWILGLLMRNRAAATAVVGFGAAAVVRTESDSYTAADD